MVFQVLVVPVEHPKLFEVKYTRQKVAHGAIDMGTHSDMFFGDNFMHRALFFWHLLLCLRRPLTFTQGGWGHHHCEYFQARSPGGVRTLLRAGGGLAKGAGGSLVGIHGGA